MDSNSTKRTLLDHRGKSPFACHSPSLTTGGVAGLQNHIQLFLQLLAKRLRVLLCLFTVGDGGGLLLCQFRLFRLGGRARGIGFLLRLARLIGRQIAREELERRQGKRAKGASGKSS